jgi:hypothetical protein
VSKIPLSSKKYPGLVALVDDDAYGKVMEAGPWRPLLSRKTFYATRNIYRSGRRTTQLLHNFIAELYGLPKSLDHANRDGLDNRRENLRPATGTQQVANQELRSDNSSGFRGVYRRRDTLRWQSRIFCAGRGVSLGCFDSPEDAARAYDKAAVDLFGEFAFLNFPDEMRVSA